MILSELVNFYNELDFIQRIKLTKQLADIELDKITQLIVAQPAIGQRMANDLLYYKNGISRAFDNFDFQYNTIASHLTDLITHEGDIWRQQNFQSYIENLQLLKTQGYYESGTSQYVDQYGIVRAITAEKKQELRNKIHSDIFKQESNINEEITKIIQDRIIGYSSWQYPAMILRPGMGDLITHMVASDPLYILDQHQELLDPSLNRFNEQYKNRLRPYIIEETVDQVQSKEILEIIPNNQFGICIVYNYFNFKPFEIIKKYFEEIFNKLSPGGVLAMTFNDCDRSSAIKLVESSSATYTPGHLIYSLAASCGFTEIFRFNGADPTTYIELQKPGSHTGIRGGQTLAKIHHK